MSLTINDNAHSKTFPLNLDSSQFQNRGPKAVIFHDLPYELMDIIFDTLEAVKALENLMLGVNRYLLYSVRSVH